MPVFAGPEILTDHFSCQYLVSVRKKLAVCTRVPRFQPLSPMYFFALVKNFEQPRLEADPFFLTKLDEPSQPEKPKQDSNHSKLARRAARLKKGENIQAISFYLKP